MADPDLSLIPIEAMLDELANRNDATIFIAYQLKTAEDTTSYTRVSGPPTLLLGMSEELSIGLRLAAEMGVQYELEEGEGEDEVEGEG